MMGANGAGKSTLVKILTGVFQADGGTITLDGVARTFRSPAEARASGHRLGLSGSGARPRSDDRQNMRLADVDLPTVRGYFSDLGIADLGFGALVRDIPYPVLRLIDLARALASEPVVLMLDEITAALPTDLSERVFAVVRRWRERGNSVIFISHRMAEVAALCDRATVLRDGVSVGVTDTARGSEERIVSLMLGADMAKTGSAQAAAGRIERDATGACRRSRFAILVTATCSTNVSFGLRAGEILGVAALEGQGQQELFDCIAGVRRSDGGEILAHGRKLKLNHPGDAIAAGLVLVPGESPSGAAAAALDPRKRGFAACPQPDELGPHPRRPRARARRRGGQEAADRHPRRVGSAPAQRRQPAEGGDRAMDRGRVSRRCFASTRRAASTSAPSIRSIGCCARWPAAGSAVLLFTSELPEIPLVCDRAIVLFGGEIVAEMPAADADEGTLLRAAHGIGIAAMRRRAALPREPASARARGATTPSPTIVPERRRARRSRACREVRAALPAIPRCSACRCCWRSSSRPPSRSIPGSIRSTPNRSRWRRCRWPSPPRRRPWS